MCRWLERDPAGYQDGPSLYSYLGRNPMAGTDPYGLHLQSIRSLVTARKLLRRSYPHRELPPGVYWGTRDLAGPPLGNHHYLLIVLAHQSEDPEGWATRISPTQHGFILAGFKGEQRKNEADGMLVHQLNAIDDLTAVKEYLGPPSDRVPILGWEAELRRVEPPSGMDQQQFVETLVERTQAYVRNSNREAVRYRLGFRIGGGCNCATWVDGLLRSAGVSARDRLNAGEFHGVDWGEENGHLLERQFGWAPGVLGGSPRAPVPSSPNPSPRPAVAPRYH